MNDVFFSVIIPTFNRANFIDKTIQSLLNQTYPHFEIIVVDDGSTDNTEEVVKKINDSRIKYFKKANAERGAARNFGTRQAKGDFVNFFDSDDIAYSNHFMTAFELINNSKNCLVFALNYDIKNTNNEILRLPTPFMNINRQLIKGNLLSCNGVFIKREVALDYPFSEIRELSASEDYLLWLELAANFTYIFSKIQTWAIVEHDNRSVLVINKDSLIKRKELMLKLALENAAICNYFTDQLHLLKTNTYSYIALHLAMVNYKKESLRYLSKSILQSPSFISKKRFFAIIKHLLF